MHQIPTDVTAVNDLGRIIRECQLRITCAYTSKGDSHALVAVACGSICLQAYVEAGALAPDVLDHLAETADNLGLGDRVGFEAVDIALDAGPLLYDALADYWQRSQAKPLAQVAA